VQQRQVLVIADSLSYHGPTQPEVPTDPRLYPNVLAATLGPDVRVNVVARPGWTSRDAWWALTKDPQVWGRLLPTADAVVLAASNMDQLPAAIPTYLREGISYLRPGPLRRRVRNAYLTTAPQIIRATNGPFRQLPQDVTDRYLTRCVEAIRYLRPGIPVVLLAPSPYRAVTYPSGAYHARAVASARVWAALHDVVLVETDRRVLPSLRDGTGNPDGMHWSFDVHAAVGRDLAAAISQQGFASSIADINKDAGVDGSVRMDDDQAHHDS